MQTRASRSFELKRSGDSDDFTIKSTFNLHMTKATSSTHEAVQDKEQPDRVLVPLKVAVLKISDTRTESNDDVGKALVQAVSDAGHEVTEKKIVRDDKYEIRAAVSNWIASREAGVIITTGGTGITGRDGTPEALVPLFDKELTGFGELFRSMSFEKIGLSSMQSRCTAGVANGVYIFCLPGSKGAVRDGWQLIAPQLDSRTRPCNLVMHISRLTEK